MQQCECKLLCCSGKDLRLPGSRFILYKRQSTATTVSKEGCGDDVENSFQLYYIQADPPNLLGQALLVDRLWSLKYR
jgi:hypothetical protein